MADQTPTTYYITARDLPAAVAMDNVTYTDALAVAGPCVAGSRILTGPDEGPVGYVVDFGAVAGVTVTQRQPAGPAMRMPDDLVKQLVAEAAEETAHTPDDVDTA